MPVETITTITKMIESLPDNQQEKVVEHLREYIADLEDEIRWDIKFRNTQSGHNQETGSGLRCCIF